MEEDRTRCSREDAFQKRKGRKAPKAKTNDPEYNSTLNKGFYEVIWRLRCKAVAEFENSSGIKERKRKKIPETGNENEEEKIERSKKRWRMKESNKKNNVASETKQGKLSKIYCEIKEIIVEELLVQHREFQGIVKKNGSGMDTKIFSKQLQQKMAQMKRKR
ncbi:35129_t:CDS:2 [Gigaspora margarita]|uniref:35129_t:CDS:1 n=1 Tax=Gigaspora margarita TaxID=4874 RepID=A0ABN7UJS5_GIGMA|nr:35129_t:CDS:2 [Gigaspora margarita]